MVRVSFPSLGASRASPAPAPEPEERFHFLICLEITPESTWPVAGHLYRTLLLLLAKAVGPRGPTLLDVPWHSLG